MSVQPHPNLNHRGEDFFVCFHKNEATDTILKQISPTDNKNKPWGVRKIVENI